MLLFLVLASLFTGAVCAVTSQDCSDVGEHFSSIDPLIAGFFYPQYGKMALQ